MYVLSMLKNTVRVTRVSAPEEVVSEYTIVDGELHWEQGKPLGDVFAREDRMIQAAGTHGGLLEALTINGTWRTSL